jgi:ferredoxin
MHLAQMHSPPTPLSWRIGWWGHIIGIYLLLNYIPRSKHFHIIMAFPNVYSSKLEPKGQVGQCRIHHPRGESDDGSERSKRSNGDGTIPRLGARDVIDLPWTNLMNAYTCTECGRCTDVCPANITGKKLSPRKIIMDTRDRMEELQRQNLLTPDAVKTNADKETKRTLLNDFISCRGTLGLHDLQCLHRGLPRQH